MFFVVTLLLAAAACGQGAPEAPSVGEETQAETEAQAEPEGAEEGGEIEVTGDTPGERAANALKAMDLPADTTFTVFSEDLTIKMADVNIDQFKEETGFTLETEEAPFLEHRTKIMQDAVNQAGQYDLVILQTSWMGDLYNAGYLTPLTEWVDKYDPELEGMISPFNRVWSNYAGEVYGLPTDGDTFILYYRTDLFEDPDEQAAFEQEYGHELAPPTTWEEFNHIAEFFTRPDENLYGATEWRVKGVTYFWFFQRLASLGGSYFDEDMNAAINSAEGVQALEDLKEMNQWMASDVNSYGYVETVEAFASGQAAMLNTWPAAGKNFVDSENSEVVGKVGYTTTPGYVVDGEPNPVTLTVPGYSLVVNADSTLPKEAVYLVAQWLVSSEQLKRANMNLSGNTDVLRESIFEDPEMRDIFPGAGEYLDAQRANIAQGYPEPILPGYDQYMQALEIQISNYLTGEVDSAQEALDSAAAEWDKITDEHDREQQKVLFNQFMEAYFQASE